MIQLVPTVIDYRSLDELSAGQGAAPAVTAT